MVRPEAWWHEGRRRHEVISLQVLSVIEFPLSVPGWWLVFDVTVCPCLCFSLKWTSDVMKTFHSLTNAAFILLYFFFIRVFILSTFRTLSMEWRHQHWPAASHQPRQTPYIPLDILTSYNTVFSSHTCTNIFHPSFSHCWPDLPLVIKNTVSNVHQSCISTLPTSLLSCSRIFATVLLSSQLCLCLLFIEPKPRPFILQATSMIF